jgi:hypothetical protein
MHALPLRLGLALLLPLPLLLLLDVHGEVALAERAASVDAEPVSEALHVEVVLALQVLHLVLLLELRAADRAQLLLSVLTRLELPLGYQPDQRFGKPLVRFGLVARCQLLCQVGGTATPQFLCSHQHPHLLHHPVPHRLPLNHFHLLIYPDSMDPSGGQKVTI